MLSADQRKLVSKDFITNMWGNPNLETNHTLISARLGKTRYSRATFKLGRTTYRTPDSDVNYQIYSLSRFGINGLGGGNLPRDQWAPVIEYCTEFDLVLRCRFKDSQFYVDYDSTYLMLTSTGAILLATEMIAGVETDLIIDVRSSELDSTCNITMESSVLNNSQEVAKWLTNYRTKDYPTEVIVDNCRQAVPSNANLNVGSKVVTIRDTSMMTTIQWPLITTDTYTLTNGDEYYLLEVVDHFTEDLYHAHDLRIYLSINGVSVLLDNNDTSDTLAQVTNRHVGLSVDYVDRILNNVGGHVRDVVLDGYITTPAQIVVGNMNYLSSLKWFEPEEVVETLHQSDRSPTILSARYLHESVISEYLKMSRGDLARVGSLYPIGETDRLFNLNPIASSNFGTHFRELNENMAIRYVYDEGVVVDEYPTYNTHKGGNLELIYKTPLKIHTSTVDISDFALLGVFTSDGTIAEEDVDYQYLTETTIKLTVGTVAVDMQSSLTLEKELTGEMYILEIEDLAILLSFSDLTVFMTEKSGNIRYAHPGIDYTTSGNEIVVWNPDNVKISALVTPTLETSVIQTGWTSNGRVVVDTGLLAESPDTYKVHVDNKMYAPDEIPWLNQYQVSEAIDLANGKPFSIVGKLLTNYTDISIASIKDLRAVHNQNLTDIATYLGYGAPDEDLGNSVFHEYYYLVSPFLVDIVYGMKIGVIKVDDDSMSRMSLEDLIGRDTMLKFENGYCPSTSTTLPINSVVKIGGSYDITDKVALTPHEYRFIDEVNTTFMKSAVILNEFFELTK